MQTCIKESNHEPTVGRSLKAVGEQFEPRKRLIHLFSSLHQSYKVNPTFPPACVGTPDPIIHLGRQGSRFSNHLLTGGKSVIQVCIQGLLLQSFVHISPWLLILSGGTLAPIRTFTKGAKARDKRPQVDNTQ